MKKGTILGGPTAVIAEKEILVGELTTFLSQRKLGHG